MGDVADMMLDGDLCEGCGVANHNGGDGYPWYCEDCAEHQAQYNKEAKRQQIINRTKEASFLTGWNKHTEFHWTRKVNGIHVDYWPTVYKMRALGKTRHGIKPTKVVDKLNELLKGKF